jgi:hypothetical protein
MRNYWMRIFFGALAIFAVGMVGVTLARQGAGKVRGMVEGSGPITLPVAFIPFKLDGEKIGTIQRIKIYRTTPNHVRSINVRVRLADSVSPGRLDPCILVAEGYEDMNSKTTVLCSNAEDTVGENLVPVGQIALSGSDRSFKLYMAREALQELTDSDSDVVFVGEDSLGPRGVNADSIAERAERRADSLLHARRPMIDSLAVEAPSPAHGPPPRPKRMADSARTR